MTDRGVEGRRPALDTGYTANADALGTLRLLEAIRILRMKDRVREPTRGETFVTRKITRAVAATEPGLHGRAVGHTFPS